MTGPHLLDLGPSDVHVDGSVGKQKNLADDLSAEERKKLPAESFALPETRQYPIHDAAHVRNAAARLEQNKGSLSPSKYRAARAAIARAAKRLGVESEYNRRRPARTHLTIDHPQHGRIEVRTMRDGVAMLLGAYLPLGRDAAGKDGERVWVQVAKPGEFRGHVSGAFKLDAKVFSEVIRNLKQIDGKVAFDFEHASEGDPTQGSVPTEGAPAQGWIYDLSDRGAEGLWACVEWLEPARSYIREGKYQGISPAIRFNCKHPVTGAPIGARLSSAALTNKPFLRGMAPVTASDGGGGAVVQLGAYCYSTNESMPRVRKALRLDDLATARECKDRLCRLEDYLGMADGDHTRSVQGVPLGEHLAPLRELAAAGPTHTWEQVFEAVHAIVDEAIEEHELAFHEGEEPGGAPPITETKTMTMTDEERRLLTDAQTKSTKAELELAEARAKLAQAEVDLKASRDAEQTRLLADREREVDEAIVVYGAKKGVGKEQRPAMLKLHAADPDAFRQIYPPVPADKRVLLSTFVPPREKNPGGAPLTNGQGGGGSIGLLELTDRILAERKCSYEEAQALAFNAWSQGAKTIGEQNGR